MRSSGLFLLLVLAVASGLSACANRRETHDSNSSNQYISSETSDDSISTSERPAKRRNLDLVGPGTLVELRHPEDKALNGKYRIDFDGNLRLPYKITLRINNVPQDTLAKLIRDAYSPFFKDGNTPQFSVLERKLWLEVRGHAKSPGRYLVDSSTSAEALLAKAGGPSSPVSVVKITHQGQTKKSALMQDLISRPQTDSLWEAGDTIFFLDEESRTSVELSANKVQVLGEVKNIGSISHIKGQDFYYYLSKAGGPTSQANLSKVEIIRGNPGNKISQVFNLNDPSKLPSIMEGDVIIVHAEKTRMWERVIQSAAQVASIISAIALMVLVL